MGETTTIRVSHENADELYELQGRGDSYNDVVSELLEFYKENHEDE